MRILALLPLSCAMACLVPPPDVESQRATENAETAASPKPPCDAAETARIRQAVETKSDPAVGSAVAVRSACGTRFFSSGPTRPAPTSLHRIGSISKTYVAALMLVLEKSGVLSLDDKVSRWIDGVPNGDIITIRQLLTHRSGLFSPTDDPEVWPLTEPRSWEPEELLAVVQRHEPLFEPGEKYAYSNANFLVAGLIASAATTKPLSTLLHERVLDPLNLKSTFFLPDDSLGSLELTPGLNYEEEDVTNLTDGSWAWGFGSIAATPGDVAEWMDSLASGRFLDFASQAKLLSPTPTDDAAQNIGLGVFIWPASDGAGVAIGHGGTFDGYENLAVYFEDLHATVAAVVDHWPAPEGAVGAMDLMNAAANALGTTASTARVARPLGSRPTIRPGHVRNGGRGELIGGTTVELASRAILLR